MSEQPVPSARLKVRKLSGALLALSLALTMILPLQVSAAVTGQGYILSKNADFSTNDRAFLTTDQLYIKVWSDTIDYKQIKTNSYKLVVSVGGSTTGALTNNNNQTYTKTLPLAATPEGTAKLTITLKDNKARLFQLTDELLSIQKPMVATPSASPAAGLYYSTQTVTLSCSTTGAVVRYTTDGSNPTSSSPAYSSPIQVATDKTIKAIAIKTGWRDSSVLTAAYRITGTVATPAISPAAGLYYVPQSVSITCGTTGAAIRYTVDGTEPTATSILYSSPFSVLADTTVKAKAFKTDWQDSASSSIAYRITGTVAAPSISPAAGLYYAPQSVSITCATAGAVVRYTVNGTEPTAASSLYSIPINVAVDTTVKAKAFKADWMDSSTSSSAYRITGTVAVPSISPVAGSYGTDPTVTMSCSTTGASIYYTLDGSTPSESSTLYSVPFLVPLDTTVKAIAIKTDWQQSNINSVLYRSLAKISFVSTACSANEGSTLSVTVRHTGNNTNQSVSIPYSVVAGTATAGTDYSCATSGTLTWNAGTAGDKVISISCLTDIIDEYNETFSIVLGVPTNGILQGSNTAVCTIVDTNADVQINMSSSVTVIDNPQQDLTINAYLPLASSQPTSKTITAEVFAVGGDAVAGADFEILTPSITIIPPATSAPMIVRIFDNPSNMTFKRHLILGLRNVQNAIAPGYTCDVTIQELDSDKDKMSDAWEMLHFGTLAVKGEDDADNDGMSNFFEYYHGTDPNDPQSVLSPAQYVHVETWGNDSLGDGSTTAPFLTIQKGIDTAPYCGVVVVGDGTFSGTGNAQLHFGGMLADKVILLRSQNGYENTVIDGGNSLNGVSFTYEFDSKAKTIQGFTFRNCFAPSLGGRGAIYVQGSKLTIKDCSFENNHSTGGGGAVYTFNGGVSPSDVDIFNCNFSSNSSNLTGGALFLMGTVKIIECEFSSNSVISNSTSTPALGGAIFIRGGSVAMGGASVLIDRCLVENNSVSQTNTAASPCGGGIAMIDAAADVVIRNSIITENNASHAGGISGNASGIYNVNSKLAIANCTITNNLITLGTGLGVLINTTPSLASIVNSIIWGNSTNQLSYLIPATYCIIQGGFPGEGNLNIDPALDADGIHLLPGSPCIDAGAETVGADSWFDIDGEPRIQGLGIDIGADESSSL